VGIHAHWISHLLFADDSMIFIQANQRSADILAEILDIYHRGLGQLINRQKLAIFFSTNCDQKMKDDVKASLHINTKALGESVTPDFPKKTKCITICMPGSSFMHIVTYKCIQK
jgi:hypothetical protein